MIHFITPLYRYNNLKIIYSTIKHQVDDFNWHLIEGSDSIGEDDLSFLKNDNRVKFYKIKTSHPWGHEQRNYFITDVKCGDEDWCYFLDDDNVVTWDLISTYNEEKNSNTDLVLFSQKAGLTEKIRLYGFDEDRLGLGLCDIASFMLRYRLIKKTYINNIGYRNADGHYAISIRELKNDHIFKYYPDKFVRYNSLSLNII
jgi:hypothetical protein